MEPYEELLRDPEIKVYLEEFPSAQWEDIVKHTLICGISALLAMEKVTNLRPQSFQNGPTVNLNQRKRRSLTYSAISDLFPIQNLDKTLPKSFYKKTCRKRFLKTNSNLFESTQKPSTPRAIKFFNKDFNSIFKSEEVPNTRGQSRKNSNKFQKTSKVQVKKYQKKDAMKSNNSNSTSHQCMYLTSPSESITLY